MLVKIYLRVIRSIRSKGILINLILLKEKNITKIIKTQSFFSFLK